ncbi:metallophosphoesterase family protein [Parapedobacter sp. ISTM3]|nr:metallophosphoesterase family protein [Parapedobacter sp. ISTM3]
MYQQKKQPLCRAITLPVVLLLLVGACKSPIPDRSVAETMDAIVSRLYAQYEADKLDTIGEAFVLDFITPEERDVLATNYWQFQVNVPVVVSLMRDTAQSRPPFWLESSGFKKTDMLVKNELYTYEVWQKKFPAGEIKLGINGFDKHRPVYFVSVAPQDATVQLTIEPVFPAVQHIDTLGIGSFTYHDWDGLTLAAVPEVLRGQLLLTTIRGRAREAHLVRAFRKTDFPARGEADQLALTLGEDPSSAMTVQWRTDTTIKSAWVAYWQTNYGDTATQQAVVNRLEDRLLINDRYNHRFMAELKGLSPGSSYQYQIHSESGAISDVFQFATAPLEDTFSFNWFGDTHNDPAAGDLIKLAYGQDSTAAFSLCSGDLVNTGLHRNDWDKFFHVAGHVFAKQPLMAVPGNHDSQDGLGASMFQALLDYPANGPKGFPAGLTYSFNYKNALFVMIDAASFPVAEQTRWLEETLASSAGTWKFVVFHFPPYNEVEPYPEIVSQWVPLFEKYKVDIVMGGHFHYYLRTQPLKGNRPDEHGVTYLISVATAAAREAKDKQPFVARRIENGNFYQHFRIEGRQLTYTCHGADGSAQDRLIIKK